MNIEKNKIPEENQESKPTSGFAMEFAYPSIFFT
jgi:hypothetical protein